MASDTPEAVHLLDAVIRSRKSVRAFRPDPVPKRLLIEIIETARAAPSNFNSQPWRVYMLTGRAKDAFGDALRRAYDANTTPPFSPFPPQTPGEYMARVDEFGRRLYSALEIARSDMAGRARQTGRNFGFFDAPVGMIFTTDGALSRHSWLDCGLFVQSVILAAQVRGLATCPQVSFVRFQSIIAELLRLAPDEMVTCGMSCGYEDAQAPVNHLAMPREPLEVISRWLGFEEDLEE
jgi:nitroreductase